jgi:hypothetical protein
VGAEKGLCTNLDSSQAPINRSTFDYLLLCYGIAEKRQIFKAGMVWVFTRGLLSGKAVSGGAAGLFSDITFWDSIL